MSDQEHRLEIHGLSGRVTVKPPGLFGAAVVQIDGAPAPKGSKRGTFELRREDGTTVEARLHQTLSGTSLEVDGERYQAGPKTPVPFIVLALLPIGLLAGGCLGGAIGGTAAAFNLHVARQSWGTPVKILAMVGITVGAGVIFLVAALILSIAVQVGGG